MGTRSVQLAGLLGRGKKGEECVQPGVMLMRGFLGPSGTPSPLQGARLATGFVGVPGRVLLSCLRPGRVPPFSWD